MKLEFNKIKEVIKPKNNYLLFVGGLKKDYPDTYDILSLLKSEKIIRPIYCKIDVNIEEEYVVSYYQEFDKITKLELPESEKRFKPIGTIQYMKQYDNIIHNFNEVKLALNNCKKYEAIIESEYTDFDNLLYTDLGNLLYRLRLELY